MEFTGQQLVYAEGTPYRPGVTHLADLKVRSVQNVLKVTGQPGDHGRITWQSIGVPEQPCRRWSLILHVPALSPQDAHWERVDLDAAREDAAACRAVWDRDRVGRAERFLALPAAALVVPGVELPPTGSAGDTAGSTDSADSVDGADPRTARADARLHATLRERITRCDSTEKVDAIYDAWGNSPAWDDVLTADCQAVYDRLDSSGSIVPLDSCEACDHDTHACPGCGTSTAHGVTACPPCSLEAALVQAPDRAAIGVLWDAHGPAGDGIWTERHQGAGKARYAALPATDEYPDLDEAPTTGETGAAGPACAWCATVHEGGSEVCRQGPADDPAGGPVGPFAGRDDVDALEAEAIAQGSPANEDSATWGAEPLDEPEPGPFDQTMDLADLRDLIEQALDTDTLDELYDAHCAREEGGDGLWTDDLNAPAQAAYDRLSGQQGAGTGAGA